MVDICRYNIDTLLYFANLIGGDVHQHLHHVSPVVPHGISGSPPGHDLQHGDGGLLEAKPLGKGEKRAIFFGDG